jgi:hypothetical protein
MRKPRRFRGVHRRITASLARIGLALSPIACGGGERGPSASDAGSDQPASPSDISTEVELEEAAADATPSDAMRDPDTTHEPDATREPVVCDRDAGVIQNEDGGRGDGAPGRATFQGCLPCSDGTPLMTVGRRFFMGVSYVCSATAENKQVRIKACVQHQDNPVLAGDELSYCAVIDIPREVLISLADGSELTLDGTANFIFQSESSSKVLPEDVSYTAAPASSPVTRVWIEKSCSCNADSLSAAQTLTGRLRIDKNADARLAGRIKLAASGVIPPTTFLEETVDLDTVFDMPIVALQNETTTAR